MIKSAEDLAHIGTDGSMVLPSGPCSAWPKERNNAAPETRRIYRSVDGGRSTQHATAVKASAGDMVAGLAKNVAGAFVHGKVSQVQRDERYETCKHCPELIPDSNRCAQCGCFMVAKTWIKAATCPLGKW
jgi:hypothetical protein